MVSLAVLTSSRADFGVYLPLLRYLQSDKRFDITLIAFGAHTSISNGYTINEIYKNINIKTIEIITSVSNDSPSGIASAYSLTVQKFTQYWASNSDSFHIVLCMGDRYEMQAAAYSGIPYGIKFGHFYGGDFTNGAFDNVYRNALTHLSSLHFTSTENCARRISELIVSENGIYRVGLLSLNDSTVSNLLTKEEFKSKWNIDLNIPTALITFHPETINYKKNSEYASIIKNILSELSKDYQLVITLPNSDTFGSYYRKAYEQLKANFSNGYLIENLGSKSYFTCVKHAELLIGNTSSGISETASFGKYFINVGIRQDGRAKGKNVIDVEFNELKILETVKDVISRGEYLGENIYFKNNGLKAVKKALLQFYEG